jgi:hypothetical protein
VAVGTGSAGRGSYSGRARARRPDLFGTLLRDMDFIGALGSGCVLCIEIG